MEAIIKNTRFVRASKIENANVKLELKVAEIMRKFEHTVEWVDPVFRFFPISIRIAVGMLRKRQKRMSKKSIEYVELERRIREIMLGAVVRFCF